MDEIIELKKTINEFINLANMAPEKQSEFGMKHSEPREGQRQAWEKMLTLVKNNTAGLIVR